MKVGILCVPFVTCEAHLVAAEHALQSAKSQLFDGEVHIKAIANRCNSAIWEECIRSLVDTYEMNSENNLSLAWNKGISTFLDEGYSHVLIINLDLMLHPLLLERLVIFSHNEPDAVIWSASEVTTPEELVTESYEYVITEGAHFSCFLVTNSLFQKVGEFDTGFFPAYHEDADMSYRIKLAGEKAVSLSSARFYHSGQGTLRAILNAKDEELALAIRVSMNESMDRYTEKWGGLPGREQFLAPFEVKK